jgi:uncharacterized protein YbgA (DUF1722 family)/uncharacterized protein YbbK (DUF523 family)
MVSRCLGLDSCRYNGGTISFDYMGRLGRHAELLDVCPEVELGLGVPREPLRLVRPADSEKTSLLQSGTGRDLTGEMLSLARRAVERSDPLDGFLLKSRSPSCGVMKQVKVYPSLGKVGPQGTERGLFGGTVTDMRPGAPHITEGRFRNHRLREAFLTAAWTMAAYREAAERCRSRGSSGPLMDFHAGCKMLLMARSREAQRRMGALLGSRGGGPLEPLLGDYRDELSSAVSSPPRRPAAVDVLLHALGYFKRELQASEKAFFLDTVEEYRSGRAPLSACTSVVLSWAVRFGEEYLLGQRFFEPYPPDLRVLSDSGKGRDLD